MISYRGIGVAFAASGLAGLGLAVVYLLGGQPQWEGALLMVALGGIGVGLIGWAKQLYGDTEETDERPVLPSATEPRLDFRDSLERSEVFSRRRGLTGLLAFAGGSLALAALFPLRSLGPSPGGALRRTAWRRGSRLVTEGGQPLRADSLSRGGIVTVFPEGVEAHEDAATLVISVDPALLGDGTNADWVVAGNIAYSKICTHVGCPVGLYRESEHSLLCPCHQSTFDVLDGARVVFGPAPRPLPQLPLGVDGDGYLIALGDYPRPVGPTFWNRGR